MTGKTVLVVDDSGLALMLMRNLLSELFPEWDILEAKNPNEALKIAKESPPHLAFIDFHMPGMNGLELSQLLRERQPELPIHFITANLQDQLRDEIAGRGFGFIKKPITREKLTSIMREHI